MCCDSGGAPKGLLNCASNVARFAVGVPDGAGATAGRAVAGAGMGGGNWNGGG